MDLASYENVLHDWLAAKTGLKVILGDQGGPRPGGAGYATLKVTEGQTLGQPAEVRRGDNPAPSGNGGDEVEFDAILRGEVLAQVQVFTTATTGNSSARALLSAARAALELPSQRAAFRAAGLALIDRGTIQDVTALLETRFEGRAALQVRFHAVQKVSEFTGYIATVNVEPTFS